MALIDKSTVLTRLKISLFMAKVNLPTLPLRQTNPLFPLSAMKSLMNLAQLLIGNMSINLGSGNGSVP